MRGRAARACFRMQFRMLSRLQWYHIMCGSGNCPSAGAPGPLPFLLCSTWEEGHHPIVATPASPTNHPMRKPPAAALTQAVGRTLCLPCAAPHPSFLSNPPA